MPETKSIPIGDILSILTDRLVSHDHMGGVYNILDWMTGESLFTHQLTRAAEVCKPALTTIFPDLAKIEYPESLGQNEIAIFDWVDRMGEEHGEWFEVPRLSEGFWTHIDPLTELIDALGEDNVVLLATDSIGREM